MPSPNEKPELDSLDRVLQGYSSWTSTPEPEETDPEVRRRRRALAAADANNRLSGHFRSKETDYLFEQWVQGELTEDQLRQKLREFWQEAAQSRPGQ